jgi:segregation and condensation protein B
VALQHCRDSFTKSSVRTVARPGGHYYYFLLDISTVIPHIEALIFASEKPLSTLELVELVNNALGFIEDRASLDQVESAMDAIREKYQSEFYPFEVLESGGGWQFLTKAEYHKTVAQLNGEKFLKRLSTAALETLSIIAYKQPVTKGEIENIRGVNCDYAVQKLLEKELIIITGRRENAPGQPLIYATSKSFMDYFGINSVDDLPRLKEVMSSENVSATTVGNANPVDEDIPLSDNNTLIVNEDGDIEEIASAKNDFSANEESDANDTGDIKEKQEDEPGQDDDENNATE